VQAFPPQTPGVQIRLIGFAFLMTPPSVPEPLTTNAGRCFLPLLLAFVFINSHWRPRTSPHLPPSGAISSPLGRIAVRRQPLWSRTIVNPTGPCDDRVLFFFALLFQLYHE